MENFQVRQVAVGQVGVTPRHGPTRSVGAALFVVGVSAARTRGRRVGARPERRHAKGTYSSISRTGRHGRRRPVVVPPTKTPRRHSEVGSREVRRAPTRCKATSLPGAKIGQVVACLQTRLK